MGKAWDQRLDETPRAYEAFQIYINLPLYGEKENKRSLANVAKKLGLAATSGVEGWSSKYNWVERAAAYDQWLSLSAIEAKVVALEDFQNATIQSLSMQIIAMNDILEKQLAEVRRRLSTPDENGTIPIDPGAIKKLFDAIKVKDDLARRMAGMPTTFTSDKATVEEPEDEVYIVGG